MLCKLQLSLSSDIYILSQKHAEKKKTSLEKWMISEKHVSFMFLHTAVHCNVADAETNPVS